MRAAILLKSKTPLKVADISMQDNLKYGQIKVKIKYSGICGAQINEIDAVKGKDKFLPHLLGHEGSGIVEEVGDGVKKVKKGDRVVLHWQKSSGIESETPKYYYNNKVINAGWVTTFNEKAIVSENRVTKIPDKFNLKEATLFGCSLTTAFGVVNNDAKIKIGESVVIFGVGGVGLNIAQAASLVSSHPIIGVDVHNKKLHLGLKNGLTHSINSSNKDLKKIIFSILKGKKPMHVIETTGKSEVIELAYDLTSEKGKTILVGVPNKKINIYSLPLHFEKILTGSHGGSINPEVDIPNYIDVILHKKINLKKLITHEFPLSEINKAIKLFRTGKAGRIIINMSK